MNWGDKSAQMKMSFGMIFSIILIIVFIAFAFYAIKIFLNLDTKTQVAKFVDNLQTDIDKIWRASQGSQEAIYRLPAEVEMVCFVDEMHGDQSVYIAFVPPESSSLGDVNFSHFDIEKTMEEAESFVWKKDRYGTDVELEGVCFENFEEKVNIILKKDYGEEQVYARKPSE